MVSRTSSEERIARNTKLEIFRNFLLRIHREPMHRQRELLDLELKKWMGDHEQIDDVLVMGIRIRQASAAQ